LEHAHDKQRRLCPVKGLSIQSLALSCVTVIHEERHTPIGWQGSRMDKGGKRLWIEAWGMLRTRKRWWLLPILVVLVSMAVFVVFAEGSAAMPFLYTLF